MSMICKGITEEECFKTAIEEYKMQLMDKKAISQAQRRPLWQALLVFKWLYGYGGPHRTRAGRTMQHDKELCAKWNKIVLAVKRKYLWWKNEDINPELLVEMNLYAISLMKEDLSV